MVRMCLIQAGVVFLLLACRVHAAQHETAADEERGSKLTREAFILEAAARYRESLAGELLSSESPMATLRVLRFEAPAPAVSAGVTNRWRLEARTLYDKALYQRKRFHEGAVPMEIEAHGFYFRRDLISYTKGVTLHRFWGDRIDLGLFKRRFAQSETYLTGRPVWSLSSDGSRANRLLSGNRQIYLGLGLNLGKLFRRTP